MGLPLDARIPWAAGLFEGEGCFTLDSGRILRATLTSTDEDVVRSFADAVGAGGVIELTPRAGCKRAWRWHIHGSGALAVSEKLRPYLHSRRIARLNEILDKIKSYQDAATLERVCPGCRKQFRPPFGANAKRTRYCSRSCKSAVGFGYEVMADGSWRRP